MGPLLAALPGLIPLLLPHLVPELTTVVDKYLNKEVTKEQLQAEVTKALLTAFSQIEVAEAESIAKTYASFMQAAEHNRIIAWVWATVVIGELLVLLWHQVGISAIVYFFDKPWPSSGNTSEWAFVILTMTLGGGAVALRAGPGSGAGMVTKLKSLVGIK